MPLSARGWRERGGPRSTPRRLRLRSARVCAALDGRNHPGTDASARGYLALEDWPRAIAAFERALRGRPAYVSAWNNLALAYEATGEHDVRARAVWEHIRDWGRASGQERYVERAERHLRALEESAGSTR